MKRAGLVLFLCLTFVISKAQLSEGGKPKSYDLYENMNFKSVNGLTLEKMNISRLIAEDEDFNCGRLRYGIVTPADIDIKKEGTSIETEDGKIWQFKVETQNGYSIGIIFKKYKLPQGARLYLFNKEEDLIYGAFTYKNNKDHEQFAIAEFPGKKIIIEYYEPNSADFPGEVIIGEISQSYRDIFNETVEKSNEDQYDINCPEGDDVQLEKHAVARMTWNNGFSSYLCTGALVNNTASDGTPYFLTAHHCISTPPEAKNLITYFNYENDDCNGSVLSFQSLSGSYLIASFEESDFTLLKLDEIPPPEYSPYFAGWNAQSDEVVPSGTGIHHPAGQVKKVAHTFNDITSYPNQLYWNGGNPSPPLSHWRVIFDEGYTLGGSSGSPLFDNNNRIIGQLHGGNPGIDYYGKISYSWNTASVNNQKLRPFLDPENSGIKILDGYFPSDNLPDAHLTSEYLAVCINTPVALYDGSLFSPTSWEWDIIPSTFTFENGTNYHSQNPVVSFYEEDTYSVTLIISNSLGSDIRERNDYIIAGDSLGLTIRSSVNTNMWYNDFETIVLYPDGAHNYEWQIEEGSEYIVVVDESEDSLTLSINNEVTIEESIITVLIKLKGYMGECTDSITQVLNIMRYDDIEYAHPLVLGYNGPFTNAGATVQEDEPSPPAGDCNTQSTWCDCASLETILDNSVWFTFTGPESGIAGIDAPGFDNQIAVYEADLHEDILSGDEENYTILAANDDFYGEDQRYASCITEVNVNPGQKYWVQVDGSECGAEGNFDLYLTDHPIAVGIISSTADANDPFNIYPNPANDFLIIESDEFFENLFIELINIEGKTFISKVVTPSYANEKIRLSLPDNISGGIYILVITTENANYHRLVFMH
ncbi:MAG: T9SS type A sorting domain-containing protein [Bacteroidales bacterium]|nr:T9SS type A sorting domain-containing protein [Bacteroidales bacterium]